MNDPAPVTTLDAARKRLASAALDLCATRHVERHREAFTTRLEEAALAYAEAANHGQSIGDVFLDGLAELLHRASPRPWREPTRSGDFGWILSATPPEMSRMDEQHWKAYGGDVVCESIQQRDQRLVIRLVNAAPALLAEVRALRGRVAELEAAELYARQCGIERGESD